MLSKEEQETVNSYNKIAAAWTSTLSDDFWQDNYKKLHSLIPPGRIIDLGCGSGRDAYYLIKYGYKVVGVDISEEMIRLAKAKNPGADFYAKSFYELDFPKDSFDGFWAANSLLHIPKAKISGVLKSIRGFLKPGAVGFVSMKEGEGEKMTQWQNSGQNRFFAYYRQREFADILEQNGFKVLEMSNRPPKNDNQEATFLIYYVKTIL